MAIGYILKKLTKYLNFFIFLFLLGVFLLFERQNAFSTSLLSILPEGQEKVLLKQFEETQQSKVLLLAVKGFDDNALQKIQHIEREFEALPTLSLNYNSQNNALQAHLSAYKLYTHELNQTKLLDLNVSKDLQSLYDNMTNSFFPVTIDKADPFDLYAETQSFSIQLKNGHAVLDEFGYLSSFVVNANNLDEYKTLYRSLENTVKSDANVKIFSPFFYYVENSQAIRSDVNKIILMAGLILMLLYMIILRNVPLLLNTVFTLVSSALFASLVLTLLYSEVSIFVFVFGVSISTVAVDYMFHHYLHNYYTEEKPFNKEVLFGYLTTMSAFFILSFSSFLLIRQISIFAMFSLTVSYLHFAFLYPHMRFKSIEHKGEFNGKNVPFISTKIIFILSVIVIVFSFLWVRFDFDLKHLDYDNLSLKKTEKFFYENMSTNDKVAFAIKAESIDALIDKAKLLQKAFPSAHLPLASLMSKKTYIENKKKLSQMDAIRQDLSIESNSLGFKAGYFDIAYDATREYKPYTQEKIIGYGIDLVQVDNQYMTFATVDKTDYLEIMKYDFVESLSLKERFELMMATSMKELIILGIIALVVIFGLLYLITRRNMLFAVVFLLFPIAMISLYAWFVPLNILHIFMLFIILSIGIDYAIYLSKKGDLHTQKAIMYSLVSTFAGFGVLVFSQINALHSLGMVATIGIVSILILLLFMQRNTHVS
jgi:predicted exporter